MCVCAHVFRCFVDEQGMTKALTDEAERRVGYIDEAGSQPPCALCRSFHRFGYILPPYSHSMKGLISLDYSYHSTATAWVQYPSLKYSACSFRLITILQTSLDPVLTLSAPMC